MCDAAKLEHVFIIIIIIIIIILLLLLSKCIKFYDILSLYHSIHVIITIILYRYVITRDSRRAEFVPRGVDFSRKRLRLFV